MRYVLALTIAILLAGCQTDSSNPLAVAGDRSSPVLHRDDPDRGGGRDIDTTIVRVNHCARLTKNKATELRLDGSIYDAEDIKVSFDILYRGTFNGEGHAYGKHLTWDWKLSTNYQYYCDFNGPTFRQQPLGLKDGQWHTVYFERKSGQFVRFIVDGVQQMYETDVAYDPSVEADVLAFKSMDADIDNIRIVVNNYVWFYCDFEQGLKNHVPKGGYEFTGFTIIER